MTGAVSGNWHGRVWRLAFPIIISNISVPLLGAVDTAVVGHLPDVKYLGGVAVGAMIMSFVYWGFGFLRMGTTGLTAQAHGAGDGDEVRASLARAALIGLAIGMVLMALQVPIAHAAFSLVDASPDVEELARSYFAIRVFGAPGALVGYAYLGWFLGVQNARATLYVQLWMNGLNIILDLLFVLGFGWGVEGVALATVISEYAGAGLCLWLAHRMLPGVGGRFRRARILARDRLIHTIAFNRDVFLRTICLVFAFAYFTAQGAEMGNVTLAVNAVLLNFQVFMAHGLDGLAHAVQALAGGAIGARDRNAFGAAVRASTQWACALAVGFTVVYGLVGQNIINLLTGIPEIRDAAAAYLPWVIASPVVSVWAYQLDGIFLGATRGHAMRNAMIVSLIIYLALCWVLIPLWGNHGLWLALMGFMVARGITLWVGYPALRRDVDGNS